MKARTKDISGPTIKFGAPWSDQISPETTLDFLMDFGNLGPRVTVADVTRRHLVLYVRIEEEFRKLFFILRG